MEVKMLNKLIIKSITIILFIFLTIVSTFCQPENSTEHYHFLFEAEDLTLADVFESCQRNPEGFTDYVIENKKYFSPSFQICFTSLYWRHLTLSEQYMRHCNQLANKYYWNCVEQNASSYIVEWLAIVNNILQNQCRFEDTNMGRSMIVSRRSLSPGLGEWTAGFMINKIGPHLLCD
jgi:hypothetical protein